MSCSASSNIRSNLITQSVTVTSTGSRIAFGINTDDENYIINSGITAGSLIRYDPTSNIYYPSHAGSASTAEVVGVVESLYSSSGVTFFTVVANGLINYPNLSSVPDYYVPNGACQSQTSTITNTGGKDIFFLSDGCSGAIQTLEPSTPGSIVKPVLQALRSENFNAIVLNYIGYEVGDSAVTDYPLDGLVGSIINVPETSGIPNGYIDIRDEKVVEVDKYPDLYKVLKESYGTYQESVTVTTNLSNIAVGTKIKQYDKTGNPVSDSEVVSYDPSEKKVVIKKDYNQPKTSEEYKMNIFGVNYKITGSEVVKFTVPGADTTEVNLKTSKNGDVPVTFIPVMKAKNDLNFVSVPRELALDGLTMGGRDIKATIEYLCNVPGINCPE
jgi:hypothetical protein